MNRLTLVWMGIGILLGAGLLAACGGELESGSSIDAGAVATGDADDSGDVPHTDGGGHDDDTDAGSPDVDDDGGSSGPAAVTLAVELAPQSTDPGEDRVSFAVPLPEGLLTDADRIRVEAGGAEIPAHVRSIASHSDGSIRSVQVQVDVDPTVVDRLTLTLGAEATAGTLDPVPVADTLVRPDGTEGPRVYALLPPEWLIDSGLVGPAPASRPGAGPTLGPWEGVCDYDRYDTAEFLAESGGRGSWLYDRPAALYRLHAITGDLSPLRSAYREAHIYRDRITGSGSSTRIGVPTAEGDLKYHYAQGMAISYLLTGDERFRERAEDVALRASDLWRPTYEPGGRFWTERHAGFALLAYVWAARVSDDRREHFLALADEAVTAYREGQMTYPTGYADTDARCFSHAASSAGEDYGYEGCSPWISAILADALEEYAAEPGVEHADDARDSLVLLGRMFARHGVDPDGKPYYWLAGDGSRGVRDSYDEHWGEMAYIIAMAWHHDGRHDDSLRETAEALVGGLEAHGVAPHIRSFNWQCRAGPLAALYLD